MREGKIVLLPLDERPCNCDYPRMMPKTGFRVVMPPKQYLGSKKVPADTNKLAQWLLEEAAEADAMILSLDMLIYGGIVPSRLHNIPMEVLLGRAELVRTLRARNPKMKLYVFGLIMRCPSYSSSDEEPDYYEQWGEHIHNYGKFTHLERLNKLTEGDMQTFAGIRKELPEEYLTDYKKRRETNLAVLMNCLSFAVDGTVDYFLIPQDDAAVYGFTSMDQMTVREYLKANTLHRKTAMYPSADDTGLTLLARACGELSGFRPKVYVHYASCKGALTVPQVEDRMLGETVKYHILSIGGIQVCSLPEADIVLAVNVGSAMLPTGHPGCVLAYDIERNLAEFVNFLDYALNMGKTVAVADVAWLNQGDTELTGLMRREGLLLRIHAYAGWNTSSNTIGTALCQAVLYSVGRDGAGNRSFLLHRYYEDVGYMAYARGYVTEQILPGMGLDFRHVDGRDGAVSQIVRQTVSDYMRSFYPELAEEVKDITVRMPWERMFEADIKLKQKTDA